MILRNLMLAGAGLGLALSLPGTAEAVVLKATLSGANETGGGDVDGTGSFSAEVDLDTGDVCYTLAVAKIGSVTAAHIHAGVAGKDGKPVVGVNVTGPTDDQCMAMEPDKLKEIVAEPWKYYVNVHTADFPAGAVRGQLVGPDGKTGPDPAAAAAEEVPATDAPSGDAPTADVPAADAPSGDGGTDGSGEDAS